MKKGFVITENFKRLTEAQKTVERRGAREAGLVIVKGMYGVGKSSLVERWATDNGAIFLRCKQVWTNRALLDDLAERMGLDARGRNAEVQARIIGRLMVSMVPIVLDEADHLIRSTPSLLECVRDITDSTGIVCVLVGMEHFATKVAKHGHIASRVARMVELLPLSLGDVKAACEVLSEVAVHPAVVESMLVQTQGRMRLVLNAIANLEQWAQANGWREVLPEHVKGKAMCIEFKARALGRQQEAL